MDNGDSIPPISGCCPPPSTDSIPPFWIPSPLLLGFYPPCATGGVKRENRRSCGDAPRHCHRWHGAVVGAAAFRRRRSKLPINEILGQAIGESTPKMLAARMAASNSCVHPDNLTTGQRFTSFMRKCFCCVLLGSRFTFTNAPPAMSHERDCPTRLTAISSAFRAGIRLPSRQSWMALLR